ncbi:MAG: DUF3108 domain-containing protein [Pontiellaceae bacterium]|jgi:hypothetical protein|nr:DUF3108 domain-containing protein [Pontiellaceae bacterium]
MKQLNKNHRFTKTPPSIPFGTGKPVFLIALILTLFGGDIRSAAAENSASPPPFEAGEKLTYSLGWQFITVGYATTEVLADEEINGRKVRRFRMTARTGAVADRIFKVRDTLTSLTEYDVCRSLRFSKIQCEGKTKRNESLEFDWETLTVHYHEALKGKRVSTPILEKTLDPLSAFYFVRLQLFDIDSVIRGPLTDGKRCKMAEIRVTAREQIKVNGKKYDTFRLVPDLKDVGGVFEKSKDAEMTIWVTSDHRHIPVKMTSKVIVGNFVAELMPD